MLYKLILDKDNEKEIIINIKDIRKIECYDWGSCMLITYINGDIEKIPFTNATLMNNQIMDILKLQ